MDKYKDYLRNITIFPSLAADAQHVKARDATRVNHLFIVSFSFKNPAKEPRGFFAGTTHFKNQKPTNYS